MRRDEDSSVLSTWSLRRRQLREFNRDLHAIRRGWASRRTRRRLIVMMMIYHSLTICGLFGSSSDRRVQIEACSSTIFCIIRLNLADLFVFREVFVRHEYRYLIDNLPQCPVVVDLGANIGLVSAYLQLHRPRATIFCIEPNPYCVQQLHKQIFANGWNWTICEAAIGPTNGQSDLYYSTWHSSATVMAIVGERRRASLNRPESQLTAGVCSVPVMVMNDVVRLVADHIDLLKMDIEGSEETVLVDIDIDWMKDVEAIAIDLHEKYVKPDRILEVLEEHGFRHSSVGSVAIFVRSTDPLPSPRPS